MNNFDVLLGMKLGGGGGSSTLVQKTITANGTYNPADDNADGYSSVTANVPNTYTVADEGKVVDSGALVGQTAKNIDANGLYDTTLNNSVNVSVPNTYTSSDEGKVVSGGDLVGQTATSIGSNGLYDTTLNNSVNVSVPNTYTASDEDKVVSGGELVSQTAYPSAIVANGTYDTTLNNSITVNVGGSARVDVECKDVNFYDYDGTRVYSYTTQEFLALSEMPANPTYEDLVSNGWNWTLSDAQTFVTSFRYLNIGAYVTPLNNDFVMHVTIPDDNITIANYIIVNGVGNVVTVDWGDNTTVSTFTSTVSGEVWQPTHTYSEAGDYKIKINRTTSTCNIPRLIYNPNDVDAFYCYSSYAGLVTKVFYSSNIYLYNNTIRDASNNVKPVLFDAVGLAVLGVPNYNVGNINYLNSTKLKFITDNASVQTLAPTTEHVAYHKSLAAIYLSYNSMQSLKELILPSSNVNLRFNNQNEHLYAPQLKIFVVPGLGGNANNISGMFSASFSTLIETLVINMSIATGYVSSLSFSGQFLLKTLILLSGVRTIGSNTQNAFSNCRSLTSVDIPNGVTTIGSSAFLGCTSLASVEMPSSVTTIGSSAFQNCTALTSIEIPSGITIINSGSFDGCASLTAIEIPSGVTSIGSYAFRNCRSFTSIKFLGTTPPTVANANAFGSLPTTCTIYVPTGSLTDYTSASNYPDPNTYTYVEY